MSTLKHIEGKKFHHLTVIRRVKERSFLCKCDCGKEKVIGCIYNVMNDKPIRSCGCLNSKKRTELNTTHGLSHLPEYSIWKGIRRRCKPTGPKSKGCGERGIELCERWSESFENFYKDMGKRPSPLHTVERIDVNGHYEPANCKWIPLAEQARNRRGNRIYKIGSKQFLLADLQRLAVVGFGTFHARVRRGWDVIAAASTPPKSLPSTEYKDQWANKHDIAWDGWKGVFSRL